MAALGRNSHGDFASNPNQTFVRRAASETLGSLLPFAARCTNVRLEAKL